MSFEWKCARCRRGIIINYESPSKMSPYATPVCNKCYNIIYHHERLLSIEHDETCFMESYRQDNGLRIFQTPEGMTFECNLINN